MLFNWKEVSRNLQELSKDDSKIEALIEKHMITIIKETHPDDYKDFMERNKDQLEKTKSKLKGKYLREVYMKVSNLISPVIAKEYKVGQNDL